MKDSDDHQLNSNSQIVINAQYVKDLSFENPSAPQSLVALKEQPKVDLALDLTVIKIQEDNYEVTLEIKSSVKTEDLNIFFIDLKYSALFTLLNIPAEHLDNILFVHCPTIIFPFARRIVADVSRDGGFQPLMIDPIDFLAFYNSKKDDLKIQNN